MKDRNQVQLIGYVGADPILTKSKNGSTRAWIKVATHAPKHRNKEREDRVYSTTWHTVVAWDQQAAFAAGNFLKGSHILIDGKIVYRTYENKFGVKCSRIEIVAHSLINLDR